MGAHDRMSCLRIEVLPAVTRSALVAIARRIYRTIGQTQPLEDEIGLERDEESRAQRSKVVAAKRMTLVLRDGVS